jgi:protein gp37
MIKTKIEWADYTWNPVTGCYNDCPYCYARGIARRFGAMLTESNNGTVGNIRGENAEMRKIHELDAPEIMLTKNGDEAPAPYPYSFDPTLHRYKLAEPQKLEKPSTIFVCSMADLFGDWVPDEWIQAVFDACAAAPQHRYLFLTKNPERYVKLYEIAMLPRKENFWYGATVTDGFSAQRTSDVFGYLPTKLNIFASIEPLHEPITHNIIKRYFDWLIIGAETGNRKDKITPRKKWIENICAADSSAIPIFMKDSLVPIVGAEAMRREFPWEVKL